MSSLLAFTDTKKTAYIENTDDSTRHVDSVNLYLLSLSRFRFCDIQNDMNIGQRIRFLRNKHRWNQKELAVKINVVPGAVCNWEKGKNGPNPAQRQKLCEVFKINEADLYGTPSILNELSQDVLEALQDPIAVKALVATHKNKQDIKNAIQAVLECLPNLPPQKRQALIELCR